MGRASDILITRRHRQAVKVPLLGWDRIEHESIETERRHDPVCAKGYRGCSAKAKSEGRGNLRASVLPRRFRRVFARQTSSGRNLITIILSYRLFYC